MPESDRTPHSPWRVLAPAGTATALALAGDLTLYAVLPVYAADLGLNLAALGFLLSAHRLVRLAGNPLAGYVADRMGRRRVFVAGTLLAVLSTLSYAAMRGFAFFLLGRLLWGVAWSLINVTAHSMIVDITEPAARGRTAGMFHVFSFVGHSVNPLMGGILVGWLGFRPAMLILAGVSTAGMALALVALPETYPADLAGRPVRPMLTMRPRKMLRAAQGGLCSLAELSRVSAATYLYFLAGFAGYGVVMSTISLYLKYRYGNAMQFGGMAWPVEAVGGAVLALWALISAGAAPVAGRLSDAAVSRWAVISGGGAIGMAGMVLLSAATGVAALLAGVVLIAASGGALMAVVPALVGDLASRERRGIAMGNLVSVRDMGSALAPLSVYALVPVVPLSALYLLTALAMASGVLLAWLARMQKEVLSGDRQREIPG